MQNFLGIDWGERRIGLALGDDETKIAIPYKIVASVEEILEIIKKEEISKIILGEPRKMRDANAALDQNFLEFRQNLEDKIQIPIYLVDERLTSLNADKLVGNKKTKAQRDAIAAMLILQGYFDLK